MTTSCTGLLFRCMWPILEPRPLHAHIAEARPDLSNLAALRRVRVVGEPRWSVHPGRYFPGCAGAAEVLIADCAAIPVPVEDDDVAPADPVGMDEIAVVRAMRGDRVPLTRVERAEALRRLVAAGLSPSEAGRRLRLSGASTRRLLEAAS